MKKRIFKSVMAILILIPILFSIQKPVDVDANLGGYTIEHFDVDIVVEENGLLTITETLDVHFHENRHGIYFQVPTDYKMTWIIDGEEVEKEYTFPVIKMKLLSGQNSERKGASLKIGDKNKFANEYETYKILYVVKTKDLDLDGIQSFYWNIISDTWEEDILSSSFKITMPKPFDENEMYFYTDGEFCNPNLDVTVDGNVITGELNDSFSYGEAITIKIDLPNDYFVFPNYDTVYFIIFVVGLLMYFVAIFLYYRHNRKKLLVKTVEFTAPKGVSSALVGYIIDGVVDTRDVLSLLYDWGNRGIIKIVEENGSLTITKLQELPESAAGHEKTFFNGFFGDKKEVTTSTLNDTLYDAVIDAKWRVSSENEHIFSNDLFKIRRIMLVLAFVPMLVLAFVFGYLEHNNFITEVTAVSVMYGFMFAVTIALLENVYKYKENYSLFSRILRRFGAYGMMFIGGCAIFIFDFSLLKYTSVFNVLTWLVLLRSLKLQQRSEEGMSLYGKILGLKEFILRAEKDRLDMLVKENPLYFYEILPYASALNLTKVWSEHFKNIELTPPTYYSGQDDFSPYVYAQTLDNSLNSSYVSSIPYDSSSSGGGSYGSSSGGSSGGGFGGSRGGSW